MKSNGGFTWEGTRAHNREYWSALMQTHNFHDAIQVFGMRPSISPRVERAR
eukprot:m.351805 g.351805  ORF g.351805 m.351805 type:complete len:51 (-) comp16356_c0_seq1:288-440(-)